MLQSSTINRFIGKYFVDTTDIIRCEASSNYTKLFFANKKSLVIAKTLSACAVAISDNNFIRIHQSHLVNKNYVKHIAINGNVFLQDGSVLHTSRRKKSVVIQLLNAS